MASPTPILNLHKVRYQWPGREAFGLMVPELYLNAGETTLLLGASGSGKSTLLSLICGTVNAQSGTVSVAGTDISALSEGQRDRFRAEHIGLIFQQFNLLPYASVRDNILLPLQFAPRRRARVTSPYDEARRLCLELDLPQDVLLKRAGTLSVGQQQRIAAARALIGAPPLILADEPTSALDAATQATFLRLLFAQSKANNTAILMVSHDARLASQFDHVVEMSDIASTLAEPV
ncbi:ABC transporter ATP-binding protein [Roseobacter denitrificans]|uniref:Bacitracin export ATP-binding protein n=1 Tax=Roseobacter denitrificans (strain ATCC 33942 / OCh 114) TaxID=375451 RepID=Q169I3_ROSDO|nr:ABC transporter ATP-binding protein [Roseobacter denitrificans]ABG31360.1 bacitracin export ATP-binding protein [Roseobacter denitrificans OCh 114]AVL54383.1 ABC transporter ATP-binding protein [Roseobacter denitrificans]SFG00005.1 putative ABC transport system ATP-binding protein [Roseobacter denitrificans OCh 114]